MQKYFTKERIVAYEICGATLSLWMGGIGLFDEAYKKGENTHDNSKAELAMGMWALVAILAIIYSLFATKIIIDSDKKTEEYESTIEEQQERIDKLEDSLSDLQFKSDSQLELMEMMADECNFFDENAAIVTTAGRKYHTYNCWHWSGHDIYIYNTENAKAMGYTPCLDCH